MYRLIVFFSKNNNSKKMEYKIIVMKKSFKVISQTRDNAILFICMAAFVAVLIAGYIKLFVEFLKSIL